MHSVGVLIDIIYSERGNSGLQLSTDNAIGLD